MNKRALTKIRPQKVRRERDPIPWRYCLLTLVCGLILVTGFFWGANRHFSVMEYGIKNAKLRREKEDLEAEQRRLYLMREIALSPAEIKKAAKKIGLQDLTPESIEVMMPVNLTETPKTDAAATVETAKDAKEVKENSNPTTDGKKAEKGIVKKEETVKTAEDKKEEKSEKKFDKNGEKSEIAGEKRAQIAKK